MESGNMSFNFIYEKFYWVHGSENDLGKPELTSYSKYFGLWHPNTNGRSFEPL